MMADVGQRTVAVFGARDGSLGEAVAASVLNAPGRHKAITIGISGDEDIPWSDGVGLPALLYGSMVTDIVCTIGANHPTPVNGVDLRANLLKSFMSNVQVPAEILQAGIEAPHIRSIVFISSNSAQIARSNSGPYCATKAALSMLVRVAAREQKGRPLIYAYEPGIIDGTPMTDATAATWNGPLHRIPGLDDRHGLDADEVAAIIVNNLLEPSMALNGAIIRIDGGEQ